MGKRILNRREFLRTAATVAATVVVAASGATTILASNGAWAMELKALPAHEAEVLLAMTRRLYPHEMLGDIYYAEVVEAFDAKVKADADLAGTGKAGGGPARKTLGGPLTRPPPGRHPRGGHSVGGGGGFPAGGGAPRVGA